jgi:serine/threonine protein kinase
MTCKVGDALGGWDMVTQLGKGACATVFAVKPGKKAQKRAGNLKMEFAMKVAPLGTSTVVKGKTKKSAEAKLADTLYSEYLFYQNLPKHPNLPALGFFMSTTGLKAYGEHDGNRFLVVQRLGVDLLKWRASQPKAYQAPGKLVAHLGLQMLAVLKHLHAQKYVYVDVKPDNFMFGLTKESLPDGYNPLYLADFGVCEKWITARGVHRENAPTGGVCGTPSFASLAVHQCQTVGRKDDVEAVGYVLLFLILGDLPWMRAIDAKECLSLKKNTSLADLTSQVACPKTRDAIIQWLDRARNTDFAAAPKYDEFERILTSVQGCNGSSSRTSSANTKAKASAKTAKSTTTKRVAAAAAAVEVPPSIAKKGRKPAAKKTQRKEVPLPSPPMAEGSSSGSAGAAPEPEPSKRKTRRKETAAGAPPSPQPPAAKTTRRGATRKVATQAPSPPSSPEEEVAKPKAKPKPKATARASRATRAKVFSVPSSPPTPSSFVCCSFALFVCSLFFVPSLSLSPPPPLPPPSSLSLRPPLLLFLASFHSLARSLLPTFPSFLPFLPICHFLPTAAVLKLTVV